MKILLTHSYLIARDPPEKSIMRPFPPLGIMSLASSLRNDGFEVFIFDSTFEPNLRQFKGWVDRNKPDLVGISSVEITRKTSIELVRIAKKCGAYVIVGGPDAVNARYELFRAGADWICEGEGEITILELAQSLKDGRIYDSKNIKGLYYIEGGTEKFAGKRDLIENLDLIPRPAWDLIPVDRYLERWRNKHRETALHLMSSRGCPHGCKWCSRNVFGRTLRRRSAKSFVDEIKFIKNTYSPNYFWFADDSFTSNNSWLRDFEKELFMANLRISYECLGRADEIDDETSEILKRTGARFIWLGAESGSQRVLNSMKKGFNVGDVYRACEILRKRNIPMGFFIMLGYPPEDKEDINLTFKMLREIKPDKIGVSVAYPISGTEFYQSVMSNTVKRGRKWSVSGENRVVFKAKYPSLFYLFVRRLILKEHQIYTEKLKPHLPDMIKLVIYKLGMKLFSLWKNEL